MHKTYNFSTIYRGETQPKHTFRTSTHIDSSVQELTCDWGLEKKVFQRRSVSIKVRVFALLKLRSGRWQVKRVSVTNICFTTDGKNKNWWICCLTTHWNNDWQGRGREGEREGERMFSKELTLMFPMKCENFYWLIFQN